MKQLWADESGKRRQRWLAFSLCVALASIASLPFFFIGEDPKVGCCGGAMPLTHDAWMHFNQMQSFARGLEAGIPYPRWDEATHGFGAPATSFYPPGIYYVTSAFYFPRRNWMWAWFGFYWTVMVASALAIYFYAKRWMSSRAALIAMAVYVFAPYHLLNQYQRGAMGEYFSFVWMPLLLLYAGDLLRSGRTGSQPVLPSLSIVHRTLSIVFQGNLIQSLIYGKTMDNVRWTIDNEKPYTEMKSDLVMSFAGLAASFAGFLWTHPPTAYQFTLVFGVFIAVQAITRREWRGLLRVAGGLIFGSMLAAAYFYPAIAEQHLVHYDDVERTWPYHDSYVFDYGRKAHGRFFALFYERLDRIWIFNLAAIVLCAMLLMRYGERQRPALRQTVRFGGLRSLTLPVPHRLWVVAGLLAGFLMTKFSAPLGRLIPKIEIGVFSWRMLAATSLCAALLAGAVADRSNSFNRTTKGVTTMAILLATLVMSGWYVVWPVWRGQAFEPNPAHYNYATLPRGAPRDVPPMDALQTASGQGRVTIEHWTPEARALRVELDRDDQLQFRTFDFPGWTATIDGQPAAIKHGAVRNIAVDVSAGSHRVTLEFRSTPVRRASNWISVLSIALLGAHAARVRLRDFPRKK